MFGGVGIGVRETRLCQLSPYHECHVCPVPNHRSSFCVPPQMFQKSATEEVAELGPFPSFPYETHVAGLGATFASHVSLRVRRPI